MYDLVDAGPRRRFVILGNGPMIAHNCQSTGHDVHMLTQLLVEEAAEYYGFDWFPWHMDIHDCFIAAVRTKEVLDFADMVRDEIVPVVNMMIGGLIKLRGSPNICQTWAEDKDEEYDWTKTGRYTEEVCPERPRQRASARHDTDGGGSALGSGSWSAPYHRKYGTSNYSDGAVRQKAPDPARGGRSIVPQRSNGWPRSGNRPIVRQ